MKATLEVKTLADKNESNFFLILYTSIFTSKFHRQILNFQKLWTSKTLILEDNL